MMHQKTIYTLGTSKRSNQEFLEILSAYGIRCVVDVRRSPTSRFAHFKKENLIEELEKAGYLYEYFGNMLGGFRDGGYTNYMETETFQNALSQVERLAERESAVILCAEKLPWRCHRRFIGAALEKQGWDVIHVLDQDKTWQPEEQLDLLKG